MQTSKMFCKKKYAILYFYLETFSFMIIFVEKYSILDYGAEKFDEGEARGAFAYSAGFGGDGTGWRGYGQGY